MTNTEVVDFPAHLIEEFAYKRGVPFIGSGLSATAKNKRGQTLPTWNSFIRQAKAGMIKGEPSKKDLVDDLLGSHDQLMALQVVKDYSDLGDYQKLLRDIFNARGYEISRAHESLRNLNSKITITTNFDNIYEDYCKSINNEDLNAYVVNAYNKENNIVSNIRSSANLIIKAHGSIEESEDIIFTQFDYLKARREHSNFYSILGSIFLLNTVLFIGYGINDPDINLLLNSEVNNLAAGAPDYVLLPENTFTSEDEKNWKENYNVQIVSYKCGKRGKTYGNFEKVINQFADEVESVQIDRGLIP